MPGRWDAGARPGTKRGKMLFSFQIRKEFKPVIIGVITNIILAGTKAIAGILGNTYVLIADAIESLGDIIVSIVVFGGIHISSLPPDENHPYGHHKAEPIASIVVSLALVVAAVIIAVQSVREIHSSQSVPAPWTLIILLCVIITKEILFRFVLKVGEKEESTVLKADAWHHRSDAITSLAAFVGILISLLGGEEYRNADDYAALFVSAIIFFNGLRLAGPALSEIMDTAPSSEVEDGIRKIALQVAGVVKVEKCLIRKTGKNIFADIHIWVDGNISVTDGHSIGHKVKDTLLSNDNRIRNVLVHIEPVKKCQDCGVEFR